MTHWTQTKCYVAALVLTLAPASAWAEAHNAQQPPPDETLASPADPASTPEQPPEVLRKIHLDALFLQLADPDNENWERTQNQINTLWHQSGSDSMDLLAQRADKAIEAKDYDTALSHLNDLVRLAPNFAEGWNKRATLHYLRDDYGASLEDIARTLAIEPRHFGALSGLGVILERLGDEAAALEALRRASALHPHLEGTDDRIKRLAKEVEGEKL